ncbi:MAG: hypothetical protein NTU79_00335 [Planctomycetota bacterium]|nr:hypothetical protein [Planctomycetota bacterium]
MHSKIRLLSAILLVCTTFGCTSFRTTSLYRFANDSLAPQRTNKKLKGLPVKLKVPSHISVVVYEQQVILADSSGEAETKTKNATEAAQAAIKKKLEIQSIEGVRNAALVELKSAQDLVEKLSKPIAGMEEEVRTVQLKAAQKILNDAFVASQNAQAPFDNIASEREELRRLEAAAILAAEDAAIKYALVSFNPPQYQVETQLEYTDKIFLIDFKRPAAGTLDLKNAKMDDQQYFSQVQAEIEEKTIESISGALNTIKDPLVSLRPKRPNSAKPTNANTPEGESKDDVHFQKSVVAIQRFDISEPGWEDQMTCFVNEKLVGSTGDALELHEVVDQISQR